MSLLNSSELATFIHFCKKRPLFLPGYVIELTRLSTRRFFNKVRLSLISDQHRGLKIHPEWLKAEKLDLKTQNDLFFPDYQLTNLWVSSDSLSHWDEDDIESYFYKHRWSECIFGMLTGEASAIKALEQATQWIHNPPPKTDPAWEPYSASERVSNLVILLAAYPKLQKQIDQKKLIEFLKDSVIWIYEHLEYYGLDKTNNHLFNNARALIIAGSVLGIKKIIETGLVIYSRLIPLLFSNDGFLRERSSHYQLVVATWLFDGLHFARGFINSSQLDDLETQAQKIAKACSMIVSVTPEMDVNIGDISPDLPPTYSLAKLKQLYPESISKISPETSESWKFSVSNDSVVMACIPETWPLDYADHGHADLGSFIWKHGGKTILTDPGRINYKNDSRSKYQISSKGHNSLEIDGLSPLAESLLTTGIWYPKGYANSQIKFEQSDSKWIKLTHDGFKRLSGVSQHVREISFIDNGLQVKDLITGDRSVDLILSWHFPPELLPTAANTLKSKDMILKIETNVGFELFIEELWMEYPHSAKYGDSEKAHCVKYIMTAMLPIQITTFFKVSKCVA